MRFGERSQAVDTPVSFVLEQNMVALTVAVLENHGPLRDMSFAALIPEAGTIIPYAVKKGGTCLESSLGETFSVDGDGVLAEIKVKATDFIFKRASRDFPKWSLDKVKPREAYVPPPNIRILETGLKFGAATHEASLALPQEREQLRAAGVFVGGTGAYNRHGFTAGFDIGYHQLLDGLAVQGIASLRYERFDTAKKSVKEEEGSLGFEGLCNQASKAMSWLASQDAVNGCQRIAIGHSLGGLVALDLAATKEEAVDAIVLLNSPGRSFREITLEQQNWLLQETDASQDASQERTELRTKLIAALENVPDWTPQTVDSRLLPYKRQRKLYREILDLDPLDLVRRGSCPVVIVQGATDVQVSVEDAKRLASACTAINRPHRVIMADGLDHLLKRNKETGLKALRNYRDRRRRVPIALIRKISAAVGELLKS